MSVFDDVVVGLLQKGVRAAPATDLPGPPAEDPLAFPIDPNELAMWQVHTQAQSITGLPFTVREQMASAPQVAPIISTRVMQCLPFGYPQLDRYAIGYRHVMREHKKAPTTAQKKRCAELDRLMYTCGYVADNDDIIARDLFPTFLAKYVRDSLVHDQRCAEFVPDKRDRPSYFLAVDASTIRRLAPKLTADLEGFVRPDASAPAYVQILHERVVAEFTRRQLAFGVRRPRTSVHVNGYGYPELDELVQVVTALLWSLDYNMNYFRQGSTTKGILNIVGAMPKDQLRAFRRMWAALVSGVNNAWRTPIINTPAEKGDVKWIPLSQSNRDMEWTKFNDFLVHLACSAYGMDPIEIGLKYEGAGGNRSLFETQNESRARASMERGLAPLLRGVETDINKHYIWQIDEDLEFKFVGLEADSEKERVELDIKRNKFFTIDEIRAEYDEKPLPDGSGDALDHQIWWQAKAQAMAAQQQPGGPEGGGEQPLGQDQAPPDGEEGPEPGDGTDEAGDGTNPDDYYAKMWGGEDDGEGEDAEEEDAPKGAVKKSVAWLTKRLPLRWRT